VGVLTYRPDPSEFVWTFGGTPPVRTVRPGDILEVWTEDAFGGKVRTPGDHVTRVIEFRFVNPQTGPFFVDGADGHVPSDRGRPRRRPSPGSDARHGGRRPAAFEARSSLVPDAHGGNMDTPEMRAGVTCYLGVNVEGALFSIGDGYCRQGEGETCGVAVEAAMDTVIAIDLVKCRTTQWPRLESDTHVMSSGSARPLEDAFRIAHADLVAWMGDDYGLEGLDAYQLRTQVSESPAANVVDPNYTFLAKVAEAYLPRVEAYGGVRERLRETAAGYTGADTPRRSRVAIPREDDVRSSRPRRRHRAADPPGPAWWVRGVSRPPTRPGRRRRRSRP